jgi:cytochrome b
MKSKAARSRALRRHRQRRQANKVEIKSINPAATYCVAAFASKRQVLSTMGSKHNEQISDDTRIQLWDLPLRIFHWSLVIAVTVAIVTAKIGGDWIELHGKAGLTIIGLLAFRITWGVVGSPHARFAQFAPTPTRIFRYLKGQWEGVGHNPLGAISVFALLGLLAAQAITGLFANDDIAFNGPLFELISKEFSDRLTGVHHQLSNILLGLIALHVVAVFFYLLIKKNNLIKPMITGWKEIPSEKPIFHKPARGSIVGLLSSIIVALLAVYAANASVWAGTTTSAEAPQSPQAPQSSASSTSSRTAAAATTTATATAATSSTTKSTPAW